MKSTIAAILPTLFVFTVLLFSAVTGHSVPEYSLLNPDDFKAELGEDAEWISNNVPLFECPEPSLQEIYYFRWRVYKKHIKETPDGIIITEFTPDVPWAGKYNSICCAAGHHIYEGRWIKEQRYLDDYGVFWFRKGGNPRLYSFWAADSVWARYQVNHNKEWAIDLLPDLIKNYQGWETSRLGDNGLFWQNDGEDGMEVSIGGSGYRPTINAYQYGDAIAIANLADLAGKSEIAAEYRQKAADLKKLFQSKLWDSQAQFFKTLPRDATAELVDVREELGLVPWYFNLPDLGYETAWKQVMDPDGFYAPFGPLTAERRHPRFMYQSEHDCLWNGPSWPYATTQTLAAMANLLNNYDQTVITPKDYLLLLTNYAKSQYKNGKPWIAEDLNGLTGEWIVDKPRSIDYNHSGFCDLIVSGLVGLRPSADDRLEVHPLIPNDTWDYFCLDGISYHDHSISILYDKTGERYHQGKGLRVFADGILVGQADTLGARLVIDPIVKETSAGWEKHPASPVLGGNLGTCFDISTIKENNKYRMWFSWRPRKSIALVESRDGVRWSEPKIVLAPNEKNRWESDLNRPVVLLHNGAYHMWYTGQTDEQSWIGYAASPDGVTWTRQSEMPVLSPDVPWEKVAVMCPHVIWDEGEKVFKMWYSGGEQYEPDAIGYAASPDGLHWTKLATNPVFQANPAHPWERHKVTACQVSRIEDWYVMFYIGFRDIDHAQIGIARSKDGIANWQRHPQNPIIRPGIGKWDHDAAYKPSVIQEENRWMLWYNGRHASVEQIGLAVHEGLPLGFE